MRALPEPTAFAEAVIEIVQALDDARPRHRGPCYWERIIRGMIVKGRIPVREIRFLEIVVERKFTGWSNEKRWSIWLHSLEGLDCDMQPAEAAKRTLPREHGEHVKNDLVDFVAMLARQQVEKVAEEMGVQLPLERYTRAHP